MEVDDNNVPSESESSDHLDEHDEAEAPEEEPVSEKAAPVPGPEGPGAEPEPKPEAPEEAAQPTEPAPQPEPVEVHDVLVCPAEGADTPMDSEASIVAVDPPDAHAPKPVIPIPPPPPPPKQRPAPPAVPPPPPPAAPGARRGGALVPRAPPPLAGHAIVRSGPPMLMHPGPLPKKPTCPLPPGFPTLEQLLPSLMALLPPGVPLPEGLVEDTSFDESQDSEPLAPRPRKKRKKGKRQRGEGEDNKKKRNRQIGDWVEHEDAGSERMYYQNVKTQAVQWDLPVEFGGCEWVEYKTDEGEAYYFNTRTKETLWDKPASMTPSEKPEFIKDIEANERKRKSALKAKKRTVEEKAPKLGQAVAVELPMTESEIRKKNVQDRERRQAMRLEKQKRLGQGMAFLTPEEQEREQKRAERRDARMQRETDILTRLKEQAAQRKARTAEKRDAPISADDIEIVELSD